MTQVKQRGKKKIYYKISIWSETGEFNKYSKLETFHGNINKEDHIQTNM